MMICCNTGVTIHLSFYTGKFLCFVELSTQPTTVCFGSGQTSEDAKASAALNALEHLKIMTK
jgi:RISC-loading complex subunit TARBP2